MANTQNNWQAADVVSKDDFNRIEGNVQELQNTKETPAGAQSKVDTHANSKQSHGISGGYYIAKTSRSDQLPAWNDIQGKPSLVTSSDLSNGLAAKVDKPSSATSGNIAVFDGGPGKVKDSGVSSESILKQTSDVFVTGAYTGQWGFKEAGTRTITLGFRPKAVLIIPNDDDLKGSTSPYALYGGLMLDGYPLVYKSGDFSFTVAEIISTGFRLYSEAAEGASGVNRTAESYRYIAFK